MTRKKTTKPDSLTNTILVTAKALHKHRLMDKRAYDRINKSLIDDAANSTTRPITAKEIKAIRNRANISQAVLADCLNVTPGYVSQLERGATRPTGTTLVLLNVIQRHGIEIVAPELA